MKSALAACLLVLVSACGARAEVVRWINAAGGEWSVGANWDRGTPPGAGDTARFDLTQPYTVTGMEGHTVSRWEVSGGPATFVNGGTFSLQSLAISGHVRLEGGLFNSTSTMEGLQLTIEGAPFEMVNATIDNQNQFQQRKVYLTASGVLRLSNSTMVARHLNVSGDVVGGYYWGYWTVWGPGTLTDVRGSVAEGPGVIQGPAIITNGWFRGGQFAGLHVYGDCTIESSILDGLQRVHPGTFVCGAGTSIAAGNPFLLPGAGVVLREGAAWEGTAQFSPQNRFRFEPGSSGPSGLIANPDATSLLEFVIDTQRSPWFLPRAFVSAFSGPLRGTCSVEVFRANALRVGDEVALLTSGGTIQGNFDVAHVPHLGGGRAMQVVHLGSSIVARVVAGGEPCWGADFDGDGVDGTSADIAAFFACLAGDCCPLCGSVDFNSDGDTGTDADIEAFFRVLAGEAC